MRNLLVLLAFLCALSSCSKDEISLFYDDDIPQMQVSTRSIEINDSIVDIQKSDLAKSKSVNMRSYEEIGLDDILEIPINISVVRNIYGDKYLTYNGVNKEVTLSKFDENNENLKFQIHRMPLTGLYYFTPHRLSDNKFLLSSGIYSNNPNTNILYVKDNGNSFGAAWDIYNGKSEKSFVLKNEDLLEQGPNGWMDVYSLALFVKDNALRFTKYTNLPQQEFQIRPCDDFFVKSLTIDENTSDVSDAPSFVIVKDYNNNGSTEESIQTNITERASKTSNFNRKTSVSTQITTDIKVGAFFASGKISVNVGSSYEWSYGGSEERMDSRDYNFPLKVAPFKHVKATLTVSRKMARMTYTAILEGKETGVTITERGVWENVDCTTIRVDLQETDATGKVTGTRTLYGLPQTPIGVR